MLFLRHYQMTPQEIFVTRLRRQRQFSRMTIEEIASHLGVRQELFDALERNDLSEWPRGLYARACIRAYARAVGLDPTDTVNEFCRLFPHGDRRAGGTMRKMAALIGAPSQYRDDISHPDRRRNGAPPAPPPAPAWHAALSGLGRAIWLRLTSLRPAAALPDEQRAPRT